MCTRNNSICPSNRGRKGGPVRLITHAQLHWKRGIDAGISLTQVQSALTHLMLLFPWTIFCYLTILSVGISLLGSRGRNAVSQMCSQCIKTNLVSSAFKNDWEVGPPELTVISLYLCILWHGVAMICELESSKYFCLKISEPLLRNLVLPQHPVETECFKKDHLPAI